MRPRNVGLLLLLAALLVPQRSLSAFETDQYNLSPKPLADIGNEVAEHVEQGVRVAVEKVNAEIVRLRKCLVTEIDERKGCDSPNAATSRLEYLRSEEGIAREVFEQL